MCVGVQGAAAIYFFTQAQALRKSLTRIIALPATKKHPQNEKKLSRLVFWLIAAGGLSIHSTISSTMTAAGVAGLLRSETTGYRYLFNLFNFAASRILVSYAQIQVLKPSTPPWYAGLYAHIHPFLDKFHRRFRAIKPSKRRSSSTSSLGAQGIPLKRKSVKFVGFADELEEVFFFDKHEPPVSRLQPTAETPIHQFDEESKGEVPFVAASFINGQDFCL